jgi:hypothetical protein
MDKVRTKIIKYGWDKYDGTGDGFVNDRKIEEVSLCESIKDMLGKGEK